MPSRMLFICLLGLFDRIFDPFEPKMESRTGGQKSIHSGPVNFPIYSYQFHLKGGPWHRWCHHWQTRRARLHARNTARNTQWHRPARGRLGFSFPRISRKNSQGHCTRFHGKTKSSINEPPMSPHGLILRQDGAATSRMLFRRVWGQYEAMLGQF